MFKAVERSIFTRRLIKVQHLKFVVFFQLVFFLQIRNVTQFWRWLNNTFVLRIFAGDWYNGQEEEFAEYIGDKRSILVGMPRLRQLRIMKGILSVFQARIPLSFLIKLLLLLLLFFFFLSVFCSSYFC